MNPYIGKTLGPYQVVEQIGQGGMATVFKAYHPAMDRYVALKILPSHFTQDETFVARFNQEARTLARLEHPHILPVYDYGEQDGTTYLVMRYIDAGTLNDLILKHGALDLKQTSHIMGHVARALGYAHSQGIIHRDIKPSNVLIDDQGNAFLTDFGIAKIVAGTAHFTGTGMLIGTPAYMSPEQARGQEIDQRSDIYALGVMLYEMVTGRVPFDAETPLAILMKHVNDPLPLPRQIKPGLPEILERVILKALVKLPEDRFQTAEKMAETLESAVAGLPTDVALPPLPGGATAVIPQPVPPLPESVPIPQSLSESAPASEPEPPAQPAPVHTPRPVAEPTPSPQPRKPFPWMSWVGGAALLAFVVLMGIFILPPLLNRDSFDEDALLWQESVVDNTSVNFYVETGEWGICSDGECQGVSYGADFRYADPGCTECVARFDFEVPWDDDYTIWAWWPMGDDRATNTLFNISYGENELTVNVDQRNNGNQWYELATVYLEEEDWLEVYVVGVETGYANADAVGLKLEGDGPPLDPGPYLILPGPNGVVVDNVDPTFTVEGDWGWCGNGDCGGISYGVDFRYASPECTDCFAYFYFDIDRDGDYDIWTWWPQGDDRATDTPFTLISEARELTVNVDQRHNGSAWYKLATLSLEEGDTVNVIVEATATGYANADAVALTRVGEEAETAP